MKKRWKQQWKVGYTEDTAWGKMVDVVDRDHKRVVRVDCPANDETVLKMVLDAPRMREAILALAKGFEFHGMTLSAVFGQDESTMDAIREVQQIARNIKNGAKVRGDME
jgi:hypothetical protein